MKRPRPVYMGTWLDLIRSLWPGISERHAHSVLWCCTAYPCCSTSHAHRQLRKAARRDRSPVRAVQRAHENLDREMARFHARRQRTTESSE